MAGIGTIYRKDLLDTLRDRRTLIFMLLVPTLATPILIGGLSKLMARMQQKQAVETVKIAADDASHAAYRELVHMWFLDSTMAKGLRMARSPFVKALMAPEHAAQLPDTPDEVFTDAAAFETWAREMASKAREDVESGVTKSDMSQGMEDMPEDFEAPEELLEEALDLYRVVFKGLGLIEWIDPSQLEGPVREDYTLSLDEAARALPFASAAATAIKDKRIDGYLVIPGGTGSIIENDQEQFEIQLLHDSTVRLSNETRDRLRAVFDRIEGKVVSARLKARDIKPAFIDPVVLASGTNVASKSERALSAIGAILPYIIIAFAFLGGMYPAIDIGAGEKERGTLETLVLSPMTRTQIALGKFLVILTTALTAAFLGVASISLSIQYIAPEQLMQQLDLQLAPTTVLSVALLAIPPAAAFAGIFLAISIYARSFKEAQNYITPLQFILILPAMAPMLPTMEMSWRVAAIPLVNVSMLSKDFLKGETHWGYYALTFGSCALLAGACVLFAIYQFRREEVLFRS
ncbi:MAG: sodium transport system permease protein [Planctomycetota bacterium]|jgi:sodium transport system permease protein